MIYYVSDFSYEEVKGGAESCDNEILKYFAKNKIEYKFIKSENFNKNGNKDDYYIISNFAFLSDESKSFLSNKKFVIIEHDYKFLQERNPLKHFNFIVFKHKRINVKFYYDAIAVFAQSKFHAEIIKKNLTFANVISLNGSFFSEESLKIIEKYKNSHKNNKFFIYANQNPIKGTLEAIQYCKKNQIEFDLIEHSDHEQFISTISKYKGIVFMPQSPETYCKMLAECKCLGLKIITNKLTGFINEEHSKNETNLIEFLEKQRKNNIKQILDTLLENQNEQNYILTEIVSLYKAEKFLPKFLSNLENQNLFKKSKILFINANSPTRKEEDIFINSFIERHNNTEYVILEKDPGLYGVWNIGLNMAKTEFVCNSNVDDLRFDFGTEVLIEAITKENAILAYGDTFISDSPGVITKQEFSEHSINNFSEENMIKCLPGAMPIWKNSDFRFDEDYKYAGDWEMWLRMIQNKNKFIKVDIPVGVYYNNPNGLSTSEKFQKERFLEEKKIFEEYKNIYPKNYKNYKEYFSR